MLETGVAYAHSEKGTANNCEVTDCETCYDHAATVSAASRDTNSPGKKATFQHNLYYSFSQLSQLACGTERVDICKNISAWVA